MEPIHCTGQSGSLVVDPRTGIVLRATGSFAEINVVLVNLPAGARPGEQIDVLSCGYWYKRRDDGTWPSYEPPVAEFVPPPPAGAAMLARLTLGCSLLFALNGEDAYFDFVPATYDNGTPKHPSRLYLRVALHAPPDRAVTATLRRLGWASEDDGHVWLLYG
jgi:hypothetical protein